jgi:FlaA1/EpsC-like NDP-sugar epimerase
MLLIMVVLIVVKVALAYFMSYQMPSSSGIVVVIVPALDAGQLFFKLEKRRPESRESWRYAAIFVAINLVVGLAFLAAVSLPETWHMVASLGLPWLLLILVVVGAIYVGAARMFFAMGAKQQEKQSQSQ